VGNMMPSLNASALKDLKGKAVSMWMSVHHNHVKMVEIVRTKNLIMNASALKVFCAIPTGYLTMEGIAPITPQTITAKKTATIMGLDGSQNGEHLKDGQILQEELLWCALSVDAKDLSEDIKERIVRR